MRKTITNFSKDFIRTCVSYKICDENKIRDYDIIKAHEAGTSVRRLAIKHGIGKSTVQAIIDKYRK